MNIIELAKQAGFKRHQEQAPGIDGVVGNWEDLECFAEWVITIARADEREECAKLCEAIGNTQANMNAAWRSGCRDAATEIRARGTT